MLAKTLSATTVAIELNWAQCVENTTEYAHWLSRDYDIILIVLDARTDW